MPLPHPAAALLLPALILAFAPAADAAARPDPAEAFYRQAQVANYVARGAQAPGPDYEQLAFWADARGQRRVRYAWGEAPRSVELAVLPGRTGDDGFALRFPNGLVLEAIPQGESLRLRDGSGGYDKLFEWQYQGPVDGRGTFCAACVERADAAAFVRRHFIAAPATP